MSVTLTAEELVEIIELLTDTERKLGRYSRDHEQHAWNTIEDAADRATKIKAILERATERRQLEG